MSDTNVQTVQEGTLVDLFPEIGKLGSADGGQKTSFGMRDDMGNVDLFEKKDSTTEVTTEKPDSQTDVTTEAPKDGDADILGTEKDKTIPSASTPIADLTGYYTDRIKSGKFVQVFEEDGKTPFVPKTAEEYDEVLELQLSHRLNQSKENIQKSWYESKSPAWKAVSVYAELVDDPSQLIPFLQGVRTIQSVAGLDEATVEGAEQIVRTRLAQSGDPEEVITSQIEALKTTDKLIPTAKTVKPLILQQEQAALASQMRKGQEEQQEYLQLVTDIRTKAIEAIEKPMFGKIKLKQDEKAAIYDLIAEPAEETQGYAIYNEIDDLFAKKDFETLKMLSLLLKKKDAFFTYLGTNVANQTAASLEKKLRLAGDARSASGNDFDEEQRAASITRNQFKTTSKFGRG